MFLLGCTCGRSPGISGSQPPERFADLVLRPAGYAEYVSVTNVFVDLGGG